MAGWYASSHSNSQSTLFFNILLDLRLCRGKHSFGKRYGRIWKAGIRLSDTDIFAD